VRRAGVGSSDGLGVGDHVCGFYWGRQGRDEILLPYLRAGLRSGERCLCVVHDEPGAMLNLLADEATVTRWLDERHLDMRSTSETYLPTGRFSSLDMIEVCRAFVRDAVRDGKTARMVGEASWLVQQAPGAEDFIDYESEINRVIARSHQTILCLYDLKLFEGQMLADILKTHPKVVLGDMVLDNPSYLTPDQFKATRDAY
jgi:hypothetical protein